MIQGVLLNKKINHWLIRVKEYEINIVIIRTEMWSGEYILSKNHSCSPIQRIEHKKIRANLYYFREIKYFQGGKWFFEKIYTLTIDHQRPLNRILSIV